MSAQCVIGLIPVTAFLLAASPPAAFMQNAAKRSSADMAVRQSTDKVICAATNLYRGKEVSVRRYFKKDGTEVIEAHLDRKAVRDGDDIVAAKIRQQLYDYVTGMVKTSDKDCSPNNPYDGNEIYVFDCSVSLQEGNYFYSVSTEAASWRYNDPSQGTMTMNWSGFDDRQDQVGWSGLSVTPPYKLQILNTAKLWPSIERWTKLKSAQVRAGPNITRRLFTATGDFLITPNEWFKLMQEQGDIEITLYGKNKGFLLQKTISRNLVVDTETKIKKEFRKIIEKARDNVTSCKRLDSWEGGGEIDMLVVT